MQSPLRWLVGTSAMALGVAVWTLSGCGGGGGGGSGGLDDGTSRFVRDAGTDGGGGCIGRCDDGGGGDGGSGDGRDGGDGGDGGQPGGQDGGGPGGGADGGSDGGTRIVIPGAEGWTFYGPESGAPQEVWSASTDEGGNLWVAGGAEGLFLLRPGATQFERFTIADGLTPYTDETGPHQQSVVSVAGGAAGVVYAGYLGHFAGQEDADPTYMVRSGDADRVALAAGGISVQHIDLRTLPGVYEDPDVVNGRDKIRTVWRILRDKATGNVWFGGNHGVALWEASSQTVFEHQHAAINGCGPSSCTLLSGDWFGIALDAAGDLWMGGGHRLAKLQYSTPGRFWGPVAPIIDVWPDASGTHRTDDFVQDLAVSGDALWVGSIANGLASIDSGGTHPVALSGHQGRITSLEADPDGTLWIGLQWGGLLRLGNGSLAQYSHQVFGTHLINHPVWDIQSDHLGPNGRRRLVVAFRGGAVGIYSGQ